MLRFPVPQHTDYLLNCVCVKFNWSFTFSFFVFFATSLRVRVCMACECLCVYFEFTINKLLLLLFFLLQIYYYFVCCVCTWLTLLLMFVHCLLDGCYFSLSPYSCLFFIRRLYSINYKLMSIAKAMSSQQTILNKLKSLRRFLLWKFATIRFYYSSFFKRKHCVQLDEHLVNYGKITENFYWRFSAFQFVYFTNTSTERTNTKYEAILA